MERPIWFGLIRSSFLVAYPVPLWFYLVVLAIVVASPIVVLVGFRDMPNPRDPLYYLLGAQAETLGTIFVLAFTFSVVAAQVASRYSRILFRRILGGWALWYALPFAGGIIVPLFLLHGTFFLWSTQISLLIATYCLVSLLPFTLALRRLLSITESITDIKKEITTARSIHDAERLIGELSKIAVGAMHLNDYEVFVAGVQELSSVSNDHLSNCVLQPKVGNEILRMLRRNAEDQFASEVLLEAMRRIVLQRVQNNNTETLVQMMDQLVAAYKVVNVGNLRVHSDEVRSIEKFAREAIVGGHVDVVRRCQAILYTIGERSIGEISGSSDTPREAIEVIGEIILLEVASNLAPSQQESLINQAIVQIEALGTKAMGVGKRAISGWAGAQLRRLIRDSSPSGQRMRSRAEASLFILGDE